MRLIVGLGNPGNKFIETRHNTGFIVINALAKSLGITNFELSKKGNAEYAWLTANDKRIELFKPQTFVNNSGESVKYAYKKHPELKLSDVYVIHDDLDIKLGSYKIQTKGPKEHNGLLSIYEKIGSKNFWHVRVGIENRNDLRLKNTDLKISGEQYVLQKFTESEREILDKTIEKVVNELVTKLKD